jgi:putative membrane protein
VSAPTPADGWRRVHPVTPFVRGWAALAAVLFIGGQQMVENLPNVGRVAGTVQSVWWQALLGLVLFALVAFGYAALAWRMTSYAVDDDAVHLRKGVLFRQQRHARLDRLQAVDIRQPLFARIFGLAELTLEVAGGSGSGVAIGFLKESDAQLLRADLLARAAGVKARRGAVPPQSAGDGAPTAGDGAPTTGEPASSPVADGPAAEVLEELPPVAPEQPVYDVPPGRLILSLLRSAAVWILVVVLAGVAVVVVVTRNWGILASALPGVVGAGGYLFQRFAGEFGFRAAISPDGIRLRHGLLETRAQTIPPGRVQAVSLTQGPFWRGPDWWRVKVNVAGYDSADGKESQNILLPVGPREEALAALWLVLPDLGTDEPRELIDEALAGDATTDRWFTTSPRRARLLDPLTWRRNGFAVTDRALLVRSGRLVRSLVVVPHERTQSLGLQQGPWERRRGLASFSVHSTAGPVRPVAYHLDAADAARLLDAQAVRARTARAHATPARWMEHVAEAVPHVTAEDLPVLERDGSPASLPEDVR